MLCVFKLIQLPFYWTALKRDSQEKQGKLESVLGETLPDANGSQGKSRPRKRFMCEQQPF